MNYFGWRFVLWLGWSYLVFSIVHQVMALITNLVARFSLINLIILLLWMFKLLIIYLSQIMILYSLVLTLLLQCNHFVEGYYIITRKQTCHWFLIYTLFHVSWNIIETADNSEESWQLFKDLFCLPLIHVFLIYSSVGRRWSIGFPIKLFILFVKNDNFIFVSSYLIHLTFYCSLNICISI